MMSQSPVETKEKDSKIIDENKSKFRIWYDEHIPADSYRSLYFAFIKWCIIAAVVGIGVGAAGALFGKALEFANDFRTENRYIIFFLPLAGLFIVFLYRHIGLAEDKGTNTIILAARAESDVKFRLAPTIFLATFITHIFGGSAGREGAALQMGGALASPLKKLFGLDDKDTSILIMCGMSAGFSALFGTPAAAAVFAVEVTIVGASQYSALVPCMLSGIIASMTAGALGAEAESFFVTNVPSFGSRSVTVLLAVIALGMICAVVSVLFCEVMHNAQKLYAKFIENPYIRVAVGGCIIVILTVLLGTTDYNGSGMDVIKRAFNDEADPLAFLFKLIFTALTLGAGFKGGEIVPSFFIGATLGCTLGGLLGLSPSFAAAVGLISVFCGVTNCPFSSLVLSAELFGINGLPYYALAIVISYMLSGYTGLYSAQKFHQSKFRPVHFHKK